MTTDAVTFVCQGDELSGLLDTPDQPTTVAVLVVTGGPQYRVGSHRQFVELGRHLAECGYYCLRFDHRGSGDSDGAPRSFTALHDDLAAAIGYLQHEHSVNRVVVWGLCDAASAALLYAWRDDRVAGLVLLNPWVRQQTTEAQAQIKAYYPARLVSLQFWRRLVTGQVAIAAALRSWWQAMRRARSATGDSSDYVSCMLEGARRFDGPVLLILSGNDLTAQEFRLVCSQGGWAKWLAQEQVTVAEFAQANHTFSALEDKRRVEQATSDWLAQSLR